ncbi:tetraspanin-14-like [Diadema setosum]|uniref:tetraspanin-14-like n=1 Tax=Diadema setosum TaxID=31175 RepID=UPI003B3B3F86
MTTGRHAKVSACLKYAIFFPNVVFWLCGAAILGFGVWGLVSKIVANVEVIVQQVGIHVDPMYAFIIVGGIIFLLAFLGCIGSLRENTCLLKFYVALLLTIFLAEIAVGILAYIFQDNFSKLTDTWVQKTLVNYFNDPDSQFLMDNMQEGLQCCGIDSPMDWQFNIYFNCSSRARSRCGVPFSCCTPDQADPIGVENRQCGYGVLAQPAENWYLNIYTTGCAQALPDWFLTNAPWITCLGGALILLQMMATFLAVLLVRNVESVKANLDTSTSQGNYTGTDNSAYVISMF